MSINEATPEQWDKASKTVYGKLYHPNDHAIKKQYITRHKDKGGVEDIRKAIHYLEILLERMVNENS